MKVNVRKEFRPYSISIESSKDHQDLLRALSDAISKYPSSVGSQELHELKKTLINTQGNNYES